MGHNISNSVLKSCIRRRLVEEDCGGSICYEAPIFHGTVRLDTIHQLKEFQNNGIWGTYDGLTGQPPCTLASISAKHSQIRVLREGRLWAEDNQYRISTLDF